MRSRSVLVARAWVRSFEVGRLVDEVGLGRIGSGGLVVGLVAAGRERSCRLVVAVADVRAWIRKERMLVPCRSDMVLIDTVLLTRSGMALVGTVPVGTLLIGMVLLNRSSPQEPMVYRLA